MTESSFVTIPAIRAHMGTWVYYVTTMTFADIRTRIKKTDEVHKSKRLRDMIQRELRSRTKEIASYLIEQEQRFFNAVVAGIYGGEPEWFTINIGDSSDSDAPTLSKRARESIGLLKLSGHEKIFAIDGQHRVQAIKDVLERQPKLGTEEVCVIFVGHSTDAQGLEQTRRLFTTLNKTAKPVLPGEIVALDEDDAFAIVTRQLVEDYKPLADERVLFSKTPPIPSKEKKCITTILTLFKITETISAPNDPNAYKRLKTLRPPDATIESIYKQQTEFWDSLRLNFPSIKKVTDSDPKLESAAKYRTANGGHLLFRPAGQRSFAQAVRVLVDRGNDITKSVQILSKAEFDIDKKPWINILWDSVGKRMVKSVNYNLAQNLFLMMVGQPIYPSDYDITMQYQKALKDESASPEKDTKMKEDSE